MWIGGESGVLYHSDNSGATWGLQTNPAGVSAIWDIAGTGVDQLVAVGNNGTVLTGARPYATLTKPVTPATVRRNKSFTTYGFLKPRHSGYTKLCFYRKVGGTWKLYRSLKAPNRNYSSYTKYKLSTKLPYRGSWLVKAYHADIGHRATWSAGRSFKVK